MLGLTQPLLGHDPRHKETRWSRELAALGSAPVFCSFVSSRTSAAGERVEIQGETENVNKKVVEKHSTPHSGQLEFFVFSVCPKSFLRESIISSRLNQRQRTEMPNGQEKQHRCE